MYGKLCRNYDVDGLLLWCLPCCALLWRPLQWCNLRALNRAIKWETKICWFSDD